MTVRIFRAPMRARDRDLDQFVGARFGVSNGLVGTGDELETVPDDLQEALLAATTQHGLKAGRMLERFADLPDGVFVWTQTGADEYRLGKIDGPWRYEASADADRTGIHHVRPAEWLDRTFDSGEIPPAVAETFARGGRNFQGTNDSPAEKLTASIWAAHV
ncbi:MAG: GAF domain-containing protein [Actinomycetota bacterium]|nr:GAF domain-containing protein [Actinomycetota bacterium]